LITLEERLDGSVAAVRHPSDDAARSGFVSTGVPEEDTLYPASDDDPAGRVGHVDTVPSDPGKMAW
jgi:hypothetical protein